jgi:hypothetical protein
VAWSWGRGGAVVWSPELGERRRGNDEKARRTSSNSIRRGEMKKEKGKNRNESEGGRGAGVRTLCVCPG